jgi:Kelch motif protein
MRELDDAALEARLRDVLHERLGALPLDLTVEALDRRREAKGVARRFGRGRGMTLLAAAALLLVGGAVAAGSGVLRLPSVVPPVPSPSVVAVATASPDATSPSPSESAAPSASPVPAAGPGGVWIPTGSMVTPRDEHEAVRLVDGRVLVVGGRAYDGPGLTSAELYDPASGTWSATGSMIHPASNFRATLLPDGRVLVGDGFEDVPDHQVYGAELYDPATGTWAATGKPLGDGGRSTATLLTDGTVLVTGGIGDPSQLYDPDSGTWTATGTMTTPRYNPTATLLPDGRVLVAGGDVFPDNATDAAELYDPETRSWTATSDLPATGNPYFDDIRATALEDGTVLVVRWSPYSTSASGRGALYDPATETWTPTGDMVDPGAASRTATRLLDGTVLLAGGSRASDGATSAELYDPASGSWVAAAPMLGFHLRHSAILLLDGTVLVAGGRDCLDGECVASGVAELYVPRGVSPPPLPAFPNPGPFLSPSPTPTPFPPADGPVPPNARTWKVTVDNKSSKPTTLFVADETERGTLGRLVGSVTPNVVPPGSTVEVTFTLPAKGVEGWAIFVNPGPDDGSLVGAAEIGMPGKILDEGGPNQTGWVSP